MTKETKLKLGKEALETKVNDKTGLNIAALFAVMAVFTSVTEGIADIVKPDNNREIALHALYGLSMFYCFSFVFGWLLTAEIIEKDTKKQIAKLLENKELSADIERELLRLGPVCQNILKDVSGRYPDIMQKIIGGGKLTKAESEKLANSMSQYLKSHINDARQFANLLTAAQMPQELIDKFVAEYVPDTVTFSMAQKIAEKSK